MNILRSVLGVMAVVLVGAVQGADTVPAIVQQPGTQPGETAGLEAPNKCDNCHGGYNTAAEPAHNWRGSMMAHAGRDPIFWATLAVAEQDFDGAGDLCLRCHSTTGWLAGRSTPTDGSGLAASDSDGVDCDFCHKATNPDNSEHTGVMNPPFIASDADEGYYGSGMASLWGGNEKLGPYADAEPKHQFLASRFHRSADFCGTCHDVSNPVVGNLAHNAGVQGDGSAVVRDEEFGGDVSGKAAFNNPPYKYGVVERTFSEYKSGLISKTRVADYPSLPEELQGGALEAIYQAAQAAGTGGDYQDGTPRYYTCQSCHVRPVTGKGANKRGLPTRADMPLHDMTGGNYWMPEVIEYLDSRGKLRLGGNMASSTVEAMRDGAQRAREQLDLAASLSVTGTHLKIVNHTGHKLISGYPEGRRMWLNIKWFDSSGQLLEEQGAYGPITVRNPVGEGDISVDTLIDPEASEELIFQAHYGMTSSWAQQLLDHGYDPGLPLGFDRITGEVDDTLGELAADAGETEETFHFVLNNVVYSDNRIPPYGMRYDEARRRNALPVPADQYGAPGSGGSYDHWAEWDLAELMPAGAASASIDLLYQPTSWEYIQFLVLANRGSDKDPSTSGSPFLGEEGSNLFDAWLNTGMAQPHVMASTTWGSAPQPCDAQAPQLTTATAGAKQVALGWQDPAQIATPIDAYRLYYDQGGKAQHITDITWPGNSYTDTELRNGQPYCYKLTSSVSTTEGACESEFSNVMCATPSATGQAVIGASAPLGTGTWVREGKGKNATETFHTGDRFTPGDSVVIQGVVSSNEATLSGAVVTIAVSDANGNVVATLSSSPSNTPGQFEVSWNTQAPNRKGRGGTPPGTYSATVQGITLEGYSWDGASAEAVFTLE
jgi:hypothetical protein